MNQPAPISPFSPFRRVQWRTEDPKTRCDGLSNSGLPVRRVVEPGR